MGREWDAGAQLLKSVGARVGLAISAVLGGWVWCSCGSGARVDVSVSDESVCEYARVRNSVRKCACVCVIHSCVCVCDSFIHSIRFIHLIHHSSLAFLPIECVHRGAWSCVRQPARRHRSPPAFPPAVHCESVR